MATINTLSFSEALDLVLNRRMNHLIRGAWIKEVDFVNGIIKLHKISYILYSQSDDTNGNIPILRLHKLKSDGGHQITEYCAHSEDLLSMDWINLNGWNLVSSDSEYKKLLKDIEMGKQLSNNVKEIKRMPGFSL